MLTNHDLIELTQFRRMLHQSPEVSGAEAVTAQTVKTALEHLNPTQIITNLGGHGVAGVFDSGNPGPTVLFRAELDGLPIQDLSGNPWASHTPGTSHTCGHDGHMTMLLALGRLLARTPIQKGRAILMFQPAEEDGSGARAVVADPAYAQISPDYAFAIHNEPGRPFGFVSTRAGLINCASQGLAITLTGKTAHAADPEDGTSPMQAVAAIIPALNALSQPGALTDDFRLVTLTHINVGEPSFGIAPGTAQIYATLRTTQDAHMDSLVQAAKEIATNIAQRENLAIHFATNDNFAASINDAEATDIATNALNTLNIPHGDTGLPMRASEDFGVFGWSAKAAMLCLGPGEDHAALHNPDYDFPDDLIPIGTNIFHQIARDLLG